ncbi:hypothetical protein [Shewanella sp. GutCb]|uniref:hypothetical protein n=1 Tax=Shewanella sp. GutCb TaxID=2058315 RepID=UPI0015E064A9|nr:hypothetical protein [Shewanella sp. GutCb]
MPAASVCADTPVTRYKSIHGSSAINSDKQKTQIPIEVAEDIEDNLVIEAWMPNMRR